MRIGILALQGAFIEHKKMLEAFGCECVELRKQSDIYGLDGLVLPGGESTVQGKLLRELNMLEPLRKLIEGGLPVFATCAGLILLSEKIDGEETVHLGTLPVTVKRNAYGRQAESFVASGKVGELTDVEMTFIRAPCIKAVEEDVSVLSEVEGKITAVKYKNQTALAFHPELTDDFRLHKQFLEQVEKTSKK